MSSKLARWSCIAALLAAAPLWSQILFTGKVQDVTHAPIAGARVTVHPDTSAEETGTVSDGNGLFTLSFGTPGRYTVAIEADGFQKSVSTLAIDASTEEPRVFSLDVQIPHLAVTITERPSYDVKSVSSATKTETPLRDVPQSITVVTQAQMQDQLMASIGDVVRYVPGITAVQGENNRDQLVIRGQSTSADFFLNGVRDDVQYYRDLYNLDRVEALKGPNAMIFGRGGGGGVINRVTKEAVATPIRELVVEGGQFGDRRFAVDVDQPLGDRLAFRLNGVYENADSFRKYVGLERYGLNPTMTYTLNSKTKITFGYEHFHDGRVADRGVPSYNGLPLNVPTDTYFGDPANSFVRAAVNIGTATIERQLGRFNLRSRTQIADYDRGYQNYVPGAVTTDGLQDTVTAYNNATARRNSFNQTDATVQLKTGSLQHALLWGVEGGRQSTDNFRNTGYFGNGTATSTLVSVSDPVLPAPAIFRQSATDANNHLQTNVAAAYVQDQLAVNRHVQLIGGVRFDYFDLEYQDRRTPTFLRRIDRLVSPRAGIVIKPVTAVSLYGSYSVSYLPSSGDQFSSLTTITQQVQPEKFTNVEVGVKWDVGRALSLTTAVYRLERTNTRATDPNDATRIVQTGSQRTNGFEVGLTGNVTKRWRLAGGYSYQDAFVTSATVSAVAGAQVAQVPHNTFSLWNNYQLLKRLSAGVGVLNRSDMFAAIDNKVVLPGYTRVDGAMFYSLSERMRLQVNVENLGGATYYLNADNNNNISPGSKRAVRVGIVARF